MVWSAHVVCKYQTSAVSMIEAQLRCGKYSVFYVMCSPSLVWLASLSQTFCCIYQTFSYLLSCLFSPCLFRLWIFLSPGVSLIFLLLLPPLLHGAGVLHKATASESSCIVPYCSPLFELQSMPFICGLYYTLNAKPFFNAKDNCSLGRMLLSFSSSRN